MLPDKILYEAEVMATNATRGNIDVKLTVL